MSANHGDPNIKIRTESDRKWLEFGAQVGKVVNAWAGRSDLIAYVGPNSGKTGVNPTALYNPRTAEIEVNTDTAFGKHTKPKHVGDFMDLATQRKFPGAAGAVLHEAAHARFTSWDLEHSHKTLEADENQSLHLLEESRVEGLMVDAMPKHVPFLRACALDIVLKDTLEQLNGPKVDDEGNPIEPPSQVQIMGSLAALALARVDAGVLQKSDVKKVRKLIEANLPEDLLVQLRELWQDFQSIEVVNHERTVTRMYDIAREWTRLLKELAEERGEQMTDEQKQALSDAISEAVGSDAMDAQEGASGDIDRQEMQEEWDADVKERQAANREKDKDATASKEVFDEKNRKKGEEKVKTHGRGTTDYWGATTGAIVDERVPTGPERIQANRVAEALERAKYHDRIRTIAPDAIPPGRLKTRTVVQSAAYKQMGISVNTEPWKRVKRKHTIDPNLTVGIMVDVSGSMSSAMEPMASIAWIVSEAVRRIQGRAAMVYYGNQVIPALYPGEHLEKVRVRSAHDSTERFDLAFRSLNGALNLTEATGARLLVIVSDGHYTDTERKSAHETMRKCAEAGVAVAWLGIENRHYGSDPAENYVKPYPSAIHKYVGSDLNEYAKVIGAAAEAALNKAGEA